MFRFGNPLCVEDSIAQAQYGGNEVSQSLAGDESVVAQPSAANALGKHIANFAVTAGTAEMHFVHSLEADIHSLGCFRLPLQAQFSYFWVVNGIVNGYTSTPGITAGFEIFVEEALHRIRIKQPLLVTLLRFQRDDVDFSKRFECL